MKRIALVIVLVLLALAIWAVSARGRGCRLAAVGGNVRELTAASAGLFWVETPAQPGAAQAQVRFLPWGSHKPPTTLLAAYDIRSLAIRGQTVYAVIETAAGNATGQVVSLPTAGGPPAVLLGDLHYPQGLIVTDTSICWAETRAAPVAGISQVPIMGQLAAIRMAPLSGGKPATDASPRLLAMAEAADVRYDGQLLGVRDGQVYWTEHLAARTPGARTYFQRAPEGGGEPQTLGLAKGAHLAALGEKELYWTAYSEELAEPSTGMVIRRLSLGGGSAETITDWLPSSGALLTDHGRAFYAGDGCLWQVPQSLAKPVPLARCSANAPGTVALCGANVVGLAIKDGTKGIVRTPLSWVGRLTAALPSLASRAAARGDGIR